MKSYFYFVSLSLLSERVDWCVREQPAGAGGPAPVHRPPGGLRQQEEEQRNKT